MTDRVRPLEPADEARWDDYVRRAPGGHFASRVAWKKLVAGWFGCRGDWQIAERNGRVAGILPVFERSGGRHAKSLFTAPGGLLADDADAAAALLAPLRARADAGALERLELRDQRRRWDGLETSEDNCTLILALAADPDVQWKRFDDKLRNQVRKAQKSGLETRWGRAQLEPWHRVMLENMRDLGTPLQGSDYFRRWLEAYGDDADLGVVWKDGRPISALAIVRHGTTMVNPWASSLRAYRPLCPGHLIYWDAIRRAIGLGLSAFEFGRSQWKSPTFAFKKSWGAEPAPLFYQYVLGRGAHAVGIEEQKHAFALAVRVWQHLPLPAARALGPIARRRFPEAL